MGASSGRLEPVQARRAVPGASPRAVPERRRAGSPGRRPPGCGATRNRDRRGNRSDPAPHLTGCRLSEVLRLTWEEIDIERRCLGFTDSKTGARRIPPNRAALEVLTGLADVGELDARDVVGDRGNLLRDLEHPIGRHEQELGLPVDRRHPDERLREQAARSDPLGARPRTPTPAYAGVESVRGEVPLSRFQQGQDLTRLRLVVSR